MCDFLPSALHLLYLSRPPQTITTAVAHVSVAIPRQQTFDRRHMEQQQQEKGRLVVKILQ